MLGVVVGQIPLRIGYVGRLVGLSWGRWLRETVVPVMVPFVPAFAVAWQVHQSMADGWVRYLTVAVVYGLVATPLIWFFSVGALEKTALRRMAGSAVPKLRRRLTTVK